MAELTRTGVKLLEKSNRARRGVNQFRNGYVTRKNLEQAFASLGKSDTIQPLSWRQWSLYMGRFEHGVWAAWGSSAPHRTHTPFRRLAFDGENM